MDKTGCYNNSIKVYSGQYVNLLNPDPQSIDIPSIAASLSKVCRFGGHCPKFYSVAEHLIHAFQLAEHDGQPFECLKAVFLHDAAEAYVGDMVKPLKVTMPQFAKAESRIEAAIESRFNVDFAKWQTEIKRYDREMLKAEKLEFWPLDNTHWQGFENIALRNVKFGLYPPEVAEQRFLRIASIVTEGVTD